MLDLRDGTLRTELESHGRRRLAARVRLSAQPGTAALVVEGARLEPAGKPLRLPARWRAGKQRRALLGDVQGTGGTAVAASERVVRQTASRVRLERLVAYASDPGRPPSPRRRSRRCARPSGSASSACWPSSAGLGAALGGGRHPHRGDPELQRAVRFCLFHLMSAVSDRGEAALGARGLSGTGYRGHVFWDTDVFVLPFLAATHPRRPARWSPIGRAASAPRGPCGRAGYEGARFPWESARHRRGRHATPAAATSRAGVVDVLTGQQEEHITADVAWAATRYRAWSGDGIGGGAGSVLRETARYWASRIRLDDRRPRAHRQRDRPRRVPRGRRRQRLHERHGALEPATGPQTSEAGGGEGAERWRYLAEAVVDGFEPSARRHEQFAGYFDLEPLTVKDVPAGADPADVLGWERLQAPSSSSRPTCSCSTCSCRSSRPTARFERTSTGTCRAPCTPRRSRAPVHAAVLARAGLLDEALPTCETAATIDLENRTGATAQGLHMAAMGGVWHALVHGIAGLELHGGRLSLHPHLPAGWDSLDFQVLIHGVAVEVCVRPDRVRLRTDRGCGVRVGRARTGSSVGPSGVEREHDALGWQTAG